MHHRDKVSARILGTDPAAQESRPWYYLAFAGGEALRLVHAIEPSSLDHLPGERFIYASREELKGLLGKQVLPLLKDQPLACQYSENLPIFSFLDHGTALLFEGRGIQLASSATLVQRYCGLLDQAGVASHCRAADHLYEIVTLVWQRIKEGLAKGLAEEEVQGWIMQEFDRRGLVTDHPPIVGCGPASADPHYSPQGRGARLVPGSLLQIDLWAKQRGPEAVFADISWMGFLGTQPPEQAAKAFADLCAARDLAVTTCREGLRSIEGISGAAVDGAVRAYLQDRGHGRALRHRTGHGIDVEVHGSGVNLDSLEFPDTRKILEGSCFSVEPGLYFEEWGMRTEIDVYVKGGEPLVSGPGRQREILVF